MFENREIISVLIDTGEGVLFARSGGYLGALKIRAKTCVWKSRNYISFKRYGGGRFVRIAKLYYF